MAVIRIKATRLYAGPYAVLGRNFSVSSISVGANSNCSAGVAAVLAAALCNSRCLHREGIATRSARTNRKVCHLIIIPFFVAFASASSAQDKPPVIDPTENVKALQSAGEKRQDDLRAKDEAIASLRDAHVKEIMALRSDYETQLRVAEAKRIDAIRLVDTTAVAVQNERAVATATTLAKTVQDSAQVLSVQVTKSADDLRTLVATTAAESSRSLQQQFAAITTRLSALEQGSVNTSGVGAGRSDVVGWAVGGMMLLIAVGTLALNMMRKPVR